MGRNPLRMLVSMDQGRREVEIGRIFCKLMQVRSKHERLRHRGSGKQDEGGEGLA